MRRADFIEAVNAYGVNATENNDWWNVLLGLAPVGSGIYRTYTREHVRIVVGWHLVLGTCGWDQVTAGHRNDKGLHMDAAYELAEHEDGWVVITEQTVNWTRRPTARVFDRGAVCIPVPAW